MIIGTWTKPATVGPLAGMQPMSKPIKRDSAEFLEIRDGKIASCFQYYDRMTLLTQSGIIPQR